MDELKKGFDISVCQAVKDETLANCKKILKNWRVSMPKTEPLVFDFGLGDFYKVGLIEYWISNEVKAGYCSKYMFLFDEQQCPFHSHKQKHETFFIVKGKIKMVVDAREQIMDVGDILVVPPGDIHSFTAIGNALVLEISTPCLISDNKYQEPKIAEWFNRNIKTTQ